MSKEERPLSPHLTIYRWPITMTLSILHRVTGFALSVGLVAFVVWLQAIAWNAIPYETLATAMQSLIGQVLLLGWLFSFSFHFANGVRHLIWDTGRMFEKQQADTSAWVVLAAAVIMTVGYWLAI